MAVGPDQIVRRDPRSTFRSHFALMDTVHIDGDKSLRAKVTALCWRAEDGYMIEASWMHNGASHKDRFQPSRLSLPDEELRLP